MGSKECSHLPESRQAVVQGVGTDARVEAQPGGEGDERKTCFLKYKNTRNESRREEGRGQEGVVEGNRICSESQLARFHQANLDNSGRPFHLKIHL